MKSSNWITGGKVFQKEFAAGDSLESAKLCITAKGIYEAFLNGKRVGDLVLTPGFTSYNKNHLYQEYDVTDMLKENNELVIYAGEGWAMGTLAWENNDKIFSDTIAIIAKLSIKYKDKEEVIITDETWKCGESPVIYESIYHGETFDANIEPQFNDFAVIIDADKNILNPQDGENIKEQERLKPVEFIKTQKGETVIDFGQNMTGYVEAVIKNAKKGEKLKISHAEILDNDGNFYTENLRAAKALLEYTCKDGDQTYKPHFTFMGFRYIRIDEAPENVSYTAIVVHSDMKRTGHFECSDKLVKIGRASCRERV